MPHSDSRLHTILLDIADNKIKDKSMAIIRDTLRFTPKIEVLM